MGAHKRGTGRDAPAVAPSAPGAAESGPPPASVLRLAGNTLVQIGGNAGASALGFLTFIAVTRGLGVDGFGVVTTALAYLMVPVVLAELGLTTVLVREISVDPARTEPAMRAALPLRLLVSTAAVGAALGFAYLLPFDAETRDAIAIGSIGSLFSLLSLWLQPVLQVRLLMHWSAAGTVFGRVVTLALTVAALAGGGGSGSVMAANAVGVVATFLVQLMGAGRIISLRPTFDVAYWRVLLRGSIAIGLALALAQLYFRIDALLIAAIRTPAEVGLYGAAVKLIELSQLVAAAVGISVFPLLARFVRVDRPRASILFQRTFDLLIAAAAPLIVVMMLASTSIVVFISGPEFRESGDALRLLAPAVLGSFLGGLAWQGLVAFGEDRALLAVSFCVLCLNVAGNVVAVDVWGFRGAAVVSTLTQWTAATVGLALLWRRHQFVPSARYALVVVPAAALMGAIMATDVPVALGATAGGAAYLAVLALAPGTVRDVVATDLLPAARRIARVRS